MNPFALMAKSAARVGLRRLRHGPAYPSWPLQVEVALEVIRETLVQAETYSAAELRAHQDRLAAQLPSPMLKKVRRRAERFGGVSGEWFVPIDAPSEKDLPVLFYLHGGGYVFGSADTHGDLISAIACAGPLRIYAPSYRLAPEHPFPAALDDAQAAFDHFVSNVVPAGRLTIGGDSAGGGLSLALMCRLREQGKPQPGGAVLISPWVDLSCSPDSYARNARYDFAGRETLLKWARYYAGATPLSNPFVSPIHAELHGLAPLFVVSGGIELLADEIAQLVEKTRAAHVATEHLCQPGIVHNFPMLHSIYPPAKAALTAIADFVKAHAKP